MKNRKLLSPIPIHDVCHFVDIEYFAIHRYLGSSRWIFNPWMPSRDRFQEMRNRVFYSYENDKSVSGSNEQMYEDLNGTNNNE